MKIFSIKFCILFLFISIFSACDATHKVANVDTNNTKKYNRDLSPTEKALLWKLEGNNLTEPSYIFGTIHIIPSEDFFYPTGTLSAIEATKRMIFEIDMKSMTDISAQMKMMGKAMMEDDTSLSDLLSDEEYQIVKDHFKKLGLPLFFFENMKPAFITILASPDMDPQALKDGSMKSYEFELYEIAKTQNMSTAGLETMDYQIGLFDSIPYELQAKELVNMIQHSDSSSNEMEILLNLYKDQDLAGMNTMFQKEEIMGDTDILLDNRNRNWIPKIQEYSSLEPCFYAVGAGHLVGKNGIISLLRQEGFTLTPIIK